MNLWPQQQRPDYGLTIRQQQIITLVSHGLSNKEVARRLNLCEGTVKVHLHTIFSKIGVANRTALAIWRVQSISEPT